MKFLLTLLLTFPVFASSLEELVKELYNLNVQQLEILSKTFQYGKSFNHEYTLTAIVWQESKFGRYKMNLNDPSCGIAHAFLPSVADRVGLKRNFWNYSRLCENLIDDTEFALYHARMELEFWYGYWGNKGVKRVWSHSVASYNAGSNYKKGQSYLNKIKKKIKALKIFLKENPQWKSY